MKYLSFAGGDEAGEEQFTSSISPTLVGIIIMMTIIMMTMMIIIMEMMLIMMTIK